jgi:hypothetical protein
MKKKENPRKLQEKSKNILALVISWEDIFQVV